MKNYFFLLALLFCVKSYTQTAIPSVPPYIEVTGSAEIAIKPDMYFINLQIFSEAFDGISSKEKNIANQLVKAGIKSTDFSLTALSYDYQKQNVQINGRIQYRNYTLHIQTEKQITDVYNALNEVGVEKASVIGVDYTKKAAIINKLGIEALRNARDKASSIGANSNSSIDKPLAIIEEYSGPETLNNMSAPYNVQDQKQHNGYDNPVFINNYDNILYKVRYRVTYGIIQ